jgi:molybdopterin-guanine dinucleotide biosynthesis protein A
MGRPKAWLPFDGVPLLVRIVERLRAAFDEVLIVGAGGRELPDAGAPVVRDRRPGRGPLAGLEAALSATGAPRVLAVSCDAPFLQPSLLRRLASLAEGHTGAVPRREGRLHPLLAVYSRDLLPHVSRLLDEGRLRPVFLLEEAGARVVEEEELRDADPHGLSFVNLNTPEDYEAAVARAPARVTVELFGQPRLLAGRREVAVDVPAPATALGALAALSRDVPALVGPVLDGTGRLGPGFLLSLDGRTFTARQEAGLAHGARLLLLASSAGG